MNFRVFWSAEDQQWVGTCDEYPSLSYLADTHGAACNGIVELAYATRDDIAAALTGAVASQNDPTECVCLHPRSDHGDGVAHTACCGLVKVPAPSGGLDLQCECDEFEAAQ